MVKDLFARALSSAGIPAVLEPSGLLRSDGKRPDGTSFVPVVIETIGVWGPGASDFIWDLGGRLSVQLGDPQAATYIRQMLDVAVLRGNAISVMGTFPEEFNKPKNALIAEDVMR